MLHLKPPVSIAAATFLALFISTGVLSKAGNADSTRHAISSASPSDLSVYEEKAWLGGEDADSLRHASSNDALYDESAQNEESVSPAGSSQGQNSEWEDPALKEDPVSPAGGSQDQNSEWEDPALTEDPEHDGAAALMDMQVPPGGTLIAVNPSVNGRGSFKLDYDGGGLLSDDSSVAWDDDFIPHCAMHDAPLILEISESDGAALQEARTYAIEERITIADDSRGYENNLVELECAAIGDHCTVWSAVREADAPISAADANALAAGFDSKYELMTNVFGEFHDADDDGKVAIFVYDIGAGDDGTAGYFFSLNLFDRDGFLGGFNLNFGKAYRQFQFGIDCIHIDSPYHKWGREDGMNEVQTAVHEFQHLINFSYNVRAGDFDHYIESFANEGLSRASEHLCFPDECSTDNVDYFNSSDYSPGSRLFTTDSLSYDTYTNSYFFFQYLRTRYAAIHGNEGYGLFKDIFSRRFKSAYAKSCIQVLSEVFDTSIGDLVTQFWGAMLIHDESGIYGFGGEAWADAISPAYSENSDNEISEGGARFYAVPESDGEYTISSADKLRFLHAASSFSDAGERYEIMELEDSDDSGNTNDPDDPGDSGDSEEGGAAEYLEEGEAVLARGRRINSAFERMDAFRNVTSVAWDKRAMSGGVAIHEGGVPVYVRNDGNGCLCFYSEAKRIFANPDSAYMFSSLEHVLDFSPILSHIDFSKTSDMEWMFSGCASLRSLDLSTFSTGQVTDMSNLFNDCSSLQSLHFGNSWTTQSVQDFGWMFSGCDSLRHLDLSSFSFDSAIWCADMLDGTSLITVNTPKNLPYGLGIGLNASFYAEGGDLFTELPEGIGTSITLTQIRHYIREVRLSANSISMKSGEEAVISVTTVPVVKECNVEWKIDTEIATVRADGFLSATIHARNAGAATITASIGDGMYTASCRIFVSDFSNNNNDNDSDYNNDVNNDSDNERDNDIAGAEVDFSESGFVYDGKGKRPSVTVYLNGTELRKGTDYTIRYSDNINTGTAKVTITGKGSYTGSRTLTFKIGKAAQPLTVKAKKTTIPAAQKTTLTVSGNIGKVSFKSGNTRIATVSTKGVITARKVGTVKVTISAAAEGNYRNTSKTLTIKVTPSKTSKLTLANTAIGVKMTWKKVSGAKGYYVYRNGKKIATIKEAGTVSYTDKKARKNGSYYQYQVFAYAKTGKGAGSAKKTKYYLTAPRIISVASPSAKKITVKWERNDKADGYEVRYMRNTAGTGRTRNIKNKAIVKTVLSGLKKGGIYKVSVRAYTRVGKTRHYSPWSKQRSVKVK